MTERESLFTLADLREAVALAITSGDLYRIEEMVPQDVWDRLHERDLVRTGSDISGEGYTFTTVMGTQRLREIIGA